MESVTYPACLPTYIPESVTYPACLPLPTRFTVGLVRRFYTYPFHCWASKEAPESLLFLSELLEKAPESLLFLSELLKEAPESLILPLRTMKERLPRASFASQDLPGP